MPTAIYSFCTSAHSHGPSLGRGFVTTLCSVGLVPPAHLQHLQLGVCFHYETFGCLLHAMPEMETNVSTHSETEARLCPVVADNCAQHIQNNVTKQH